MASLPLSLSSHCPLLLWGIILQRACSTQSLPGLIGKDVLQMRCRLCSHLVLHSSPSLPSILPGTGQRVTMPAAQPWGAPRALCPPFVVLSWHTTGCSELPLCTSPYKDSPTLCSLHFPALIAQ